MNTLKAESVRVQDESNYVKIAKPRVNYLVRKLFSKVTECDVLLKKDQVL